MLYIASDHGGFNLKNQLIDFVKNQQIDITDLGPFNLNNEDDYPDFAVPLTEKITENLKENKGILICRNGVGESIVANKIKGIRAALTWTPNHTMTARKDDDVNVIALPADYIDLETAKQIVVTFLETAFSNDPKYARRLNKISEIEK